MEGIHSEGFRTEQYRRRELPIEERAAGELSQY